MALRWYGNAVMTEIGDAVNRALLTIGADLQNRSVNAAPVDTGRLRRSCMVDDSRLEQHKITVGYSREVDSYAMVQHERLDYSHPKGGGPKYLEIPLNENRGRYAEYIGKAIREAIK